MQERIMSGLKSKMINRKKDNKGFTLVELIVVIVILAILAALLIPALLGWIDKAKEEQYALEARNIYLAAQAQISEAYAAGTSANAITYDVEEIKTMADVKAISSLTVSLHGTGTDKADYEITGMTVSFTSSNDKTVTGVLQPNKSWTFN